jgi:hypothetical protein
VPEPSTFTFPITVKFAPFSAAVPPTPALLFTQSRTTGLSDVAEATVVTSTTSGLPAARLVGIRSRSPVRMKLVSVTEIEVAEPDDRLAFSVPQLGSGSSSRWLYTGAAAFDPLDIDRKVNIGVLFGSY